MDRKHNLQAINEMEWGNHPGKPCGVYDLPKRKKMYLGVLVSGVSIEQFLDHRYHIFVC